MCSHLDRIGKPLYYDMYHNLRIMSLTQGFPGILVFLFGSAASKAYTTRLVFTQNVTVKKKENEKLLFHEELANDWY